MLIVSLFKKFAEKVYQFYKKRKYTLPEAILNDYYQKKTQRADFQHGN